MKNNPIQSIDVAEINFFVKRARPVEDQSVKLYIIYEWRYKDVDKEGERVKGELLSFFKDIVRLHGSKSILDYPALLAAYYTARCMTNGVRVLVGGWGQTNYHEEAPGYLEDFDVDCSYPDPLPEITYKGGSWIPS